MAGFILFLFLSGHVAGQGILTRADPGVLERVAERRIQNGWGLTRFDLDHYEVLVATANCEDLGRTGWLIVNGRAWRVLVVDCARRDGDGARMRRLGLLADVNRPGLAHRAGVLIFRD